MHILWKKSQARTNTMHVGLDGVRHLVIDHQTNVLDINTTTGKVGGDQDVRIAGTQ